MVFILSALWRIKIRGLWKFPDGRDWLWGKLGLVLMAILSKSLINFSVDGGGCVPSLLFDLRPNYGGGNEDNGDLLQKVLCTHCCTQCPRPCSGWLLTHASTRDSWTLTGKSGSVSCRVTSVFLPWEPHEQYKKAKRYDTERWTPQVGRCPIHYQRRVKK